MALKTKNGLCRMPATSLLAALLVGPAWAHEPAALDVRITDAWVRGTVTGQKMTGAFMRLESAAGASLVSVSVDPAVAAAAELHESVRDGGMARMQAVKRIDVAAGKGVSLQPGGYHVMLMDLKQPVREGSAVTLRLRFAQGGDDHDVEVTAPVRPVAATAGAAGMGHGAPAGGGPMAGHGTMK